MIAPRLARHTYLEPVVNVMPAFGRRYAQPKPSRG